LTTETEGNTTTEARCYAFGCEDRGRGHQPRKKRNATQKTGKGKEVDYPYNFQRECDSTDTKISSQENSFWSFGFQNCKKINVCCLKSPSLCGNLLYRNGK
jgi:hypothetical protein